MANPYFRNLPDFEYVNRTTDGRNISDYTTVKNLFKKGKLREDIFQDLAFFDRYIIKGDDRPDNVAFELYGDETLDWVVLLANNILNVHDEWPMPQTVFDEYLLSKYGDYDTIFSEVHHYKSIEVKNSFGTVIFPAGLEIDQNQTVSYYDILTQSYVDVTNMAEEVTNYVYEEDLNNKKREIFILKSQYLGIVVDDLEEMMEYRKGSTQYVSGTLKRAQNIRLYE
jgi:hypothetical protein